MVSSTDYSKSQFNLAAQAQRQPGSAFKMFCLTAAIEEGIDPSTTYYVSQPLSLKLPGTSKPWTVHTFGNTYAGTIISSRPPWKVTTPSTPNWCSTWGWTI